MGLQSLVGRPPLISLRQVPLLRLLFVVREGVSVWTRTGKATPLLLLRLALKSRKCRHLLLLLLILRNLLTVVLRLRRGRVFVSRSHALVQ